MNYKEKYTALCRNEPSISIFSQDWWLDATAGKNNWDVAAVEKDNKIVGSLPFYKKKKKCFSAITMPSLTPTVDLFISYPENQKYTSKLSYEKEIISELLELLPYTDMYTQCFGYNLTNWLPFYWKGFTQTTRYSYIIPTLTNLDLVFSGFRENIRREIRKAQKSVRIVYSEDIEKFYMINKLTFDRQKLDIPYSLSYLKNMDLECSERNCRKIFFAEDNLGKIHSAIYIVWDKNSTYYLMGGGDPELRTSGATSLLMWEAIQFASTLSTRFDFEGSIIEPIERYVRAFGAVQTPYHCIKRINSKLLRLREHIKELI